MSKLFQWWHNWRNPKPHLFAIRPALSLKGHLLWLCTSNSYWAPQTGHGYSPETAYSSWAYKNGIKRKVGK